MNPEKQLAKIYKEDWKHFERFQWINSVNLFKQRLANNGIDTNWFLDKICLDAGCGSGRYIEALINLGAKKVIGMDLDIEIARSHLLKYKNVKLIEGDIRQIPYPDKYFDFVCCNGVLHHTSEPLVIARELVRVLSPNGKLFLYIYHYNPDWYIIRKLRNSVKGLSPRKMRGFFIKYLDIERDKLFNFIDLLYAPIQHKFTLNELEKFFPDCHFKRLDKPTTQYDTPDENRFIITKK